MYGATCQADTDKQALTLESIFAGSEFENNLPQNIQWHNDEQSFTFTRKNPETGLLDIHEHDVAGSATCLIISGDTLRYKNEPVGMSSYQGAADGQYILLAGPVHLTWDGRNEASHYIHEPDTNKHGVERWMDSFENNPQGYYEVNLMNFADKLQGNLLLIHGTGDENVKYAFTLQLADTLIAHNKQFDMMIYPNQHHDLDDVRLHLFTRITNYFLEKL